MRSFRPWQSLGAWRLAATSKTLPTRGPLFVLLLGGILVITVLTFFPALSLGPIAEHFLMSSVNCSVRVDL